MFNVNDRLQDLRASIVSLVLLLATTIIGLVWVSVGLFSAASQYLGAIWGPIVLGIIFFLPILIFALVKTFGTNAGRVPESTLNNDAFESPVGNILNLMTSLSGRSTFPVAVVAIIASVLAARFPALLAFANQALSAYVDDLQQRAAESAANNSSATTDEQNR